MIDALTGETTIEEPVVSTKSGHIFEKRVIEKYLRDNNGKCPITDEDLTISDLLPLKVNKIVKPRPPAATSIPGMLQLFQNEWDSLMLESYTLKQQLESVRQELSHALYQHDAACRVIARLIKERDDAISALTSFKANSGNGTTSNADSNMEVEEEQAKIPANVLSKMTETSAELSKSRRKRVISKDLVPIETISEYKVLSSSTIHSTSPPGILCVDIHPQNQELILTGGADHNVVVFNRSTKKVVSTLKGHTKQINEVVFHPSKSIYLSVSSDKTARIWNKEESQVVRTHKAEVTGVSLHPSGSYFATSSLDSTWGLHDVFNGNNLYQMNVDAGLQSLRFHPDGMLLATGGNNGITKIWDLKKANLAAEIGTKDGAVSDITFSENGYYLSTVNEGSSVKLWDLRKLKSGHIHEFELPDNFNPSSASFDKSGNYLAVSGNNEIRIFLVGKTFTHGTTLTGHSGLVTDVKFGDDATFLASTSMDRNLKLWGKE